MITRRFLVAAGAATLSLGVAVGALAAEYPTRPINMVIGYKAGGGTDTVGRVFVKKFGEILGQQINVLNKPGAGGGVAAMQVKRAKPDGYTIMMAPTTTITFGPHVNSKVRITVDDFTYFGMVSAYQPGLVVPADSKLKNFKDFVAHAKANPGMKYGTLSPASKMIMEVIARDNDLKINYVPVKGGAGIVNVVLANQVDIAYSGGIHARFPDKMRLLVAATGERHAGNPDVTTFLEEGVNVNNNLFTVLAVPNGVPEEILAKLEAAAAEASKAPELLALLEKIQNPPAYKNGADATAEMHAQWKGYGELVESTGYKKK